MSYGDLSIYVLILRFGLSHRYNIKENIGWLFCTVPHFFKRFLWYIFVFTQYSYYRELFCSGPELRLRNHHSHRWVRYIDTTKITVWCMSSLILSIDLRWLRYLIMFYFKLTNDAMVKWWILKWYNGEIKKRIGHFFFHKYLICSFILFFNTTFSQQTKQSIILNFWALTISTATKFIS